MVKDELGMDAVILHTKKYKKGGFLGYKRKAYVEVTAAVEEKAKRVRTPKAAADSLAAATTATTATFVPKQVVSQYKVAGTEAALPNAAKPAEDFKPLANPENIPAGKHETRGARVIRKEEPVIPAFEPRKDEQQEKIEQLENELAKMKSMLVQVISKDQNAQEAVSLQEAMRQQEIDESIVEDMIRHLPAETVLADKKSEDAGKALKSYLFQNLRLTDGIDLRTANRRAKIAALIGATGVGKTTTLAKIAARLVLEEGVSAALITADTYRISAVEQLKTYSDIIGLPLEIVYSPAELKEAIHKHRDKQLILIDTAGRSQHNERQMKELQDFLAVDDTIEKYLVMSATTKNRDAKDILDKFSTCHPDRIIFTKTDETNSLGLIVNLLYQQKITLSYLTNGQSVPDDIVPARVEKLTELLLR